MRLRGFTLLELMIVIAVIAIIVSIAIPSLLNSRKSANEARAIATLRTLSTVQEQYRTRFGTYASGPNALEAAGYIDVEFDAYDSLSYTFTKNTWEFKIGPMTPADADRYFFVDQTGVIRFDSKGPATSTSPPIQ